MWVARDWVPDSGRPSQPAPRAQALFTSSASTPPPSTGYRGLGLAGRIRMSADAPPAEAKAASTTVRSALGHQGPYMPLMAFACGVNELASEYNHGSIPYGAFSFVVAKTLRKQLRRKNKPLDWQATMRETAKELNVLGYSQTPELVGPGRVYGGGHSPMTLLSPPSGGAKP